MILLLFLYDPLYASSHDLESDYPWSGFKDENSPTPDINTLGRIAFAIQLADEQSYPCNFFNNQAMFSPRTFIV